MTHATKRLGLAAAKALSWIYRLVPAAMRRTLVFGLATLDSRIGSPEKSLRRLFRTQEDIDLLINERATVLGRGEHPKHRLTHYHDFFVERIPEGARVLDIGCGYGAVARSIAKRVSNVQVTGMDIDERLITQARAAENPANLTFLVGDALDALPDHAWDTVVLSNILEHIDERVAFLTRLRTALTPQQILIRVPLFERNWQIPMRRELGVNYFSDRTHHIEHRLDEFDQEIAAAGLKIRERLTPWGEIWATCQPRADA